MEITESVVAVPAELEVDELWAMRDAHEYTADVKCHYRTWVSTIANIDYLRRYLAFTYPTYHQQGKKMLTWIGLAQPAHAYIKPRQTREAALYSCMAATSAAAEHIDPDAGYYAAVWSEKAQIALVWAFHRLLGGPDSFDDELRASVEELHAQVMKNASSPQGITALETSTGRFDALPNLMAMMAFELADRFLGTDYASCNQDILAFVEGTLQDPTSKLFYLFYQTGFIGYDGECLDARSFWLADRIDPSTNALAILFYNYFNPEAARVAWSSFKDAFAERLLSITAEEIAANLGMSYHTAVGYPGEALFGAIAAAAEMQDKDFYTQLSEHLFEIGQPYLTEGCILFTGFDNDVFVCTNFLAFARTHVPWKAQLEYPDYEAHYAANDHDFY